jgi:hypothetical protein
MKKLIFVDSKEQVKSIAKLFDNQTTIISLNPSANSELIRNELPHDTSMKYFGNRGHIEILRKSNEIISLLRKNYYLEDSVGVSHAYERTFFYYLRNYYLHYWLVHLQIIHNAVQSVKPDLIIFPKSITPMEAGAVINGDSSLLGYIGSLYAEQHGYNYETVGQSVELSKIKEQGSLFKWRNRIFFRFQLLLYRFLSKNKNVIIGAHPAYNLPRVIDYVSQNTAKSLTIGGGEPAILKSIPGRIKMLYWRLQQFPPFTSNEEFNIFLKAYNRQSTILEKLISDNCKIISFHGVKLQSSIMKYIGNGLVPEMLKTLHGSLAFDQLLKVRKPVFVASNQASGQYYAIGELCRLHSVKAMLISHGSHIPHEEGWPKLEWNEHARFMINSHYPLVAVQTPWAEKFLNNQDDLISKPVLTGPLLYSRNSRDKQQIKVLRKKIFPAHWQKKIFLHAATPFGFYYFHPWVNLTYDEYIKHINDLILAVEKMDGVFLALRIRLKSFPGMNLEDVKRLLIDSKCYGIYTEGSFEEYLIASDLLVSFSSTTIEEALQNRIPVLQYDPFNRYCHVPAQNLAQADNLKISPIYYASSSSDLSWGIQWIKENHLLVYDSSKLDWSEHILKSKTDWLKSIVGDKTE